MIHCRILDPGGMLVHKRVLLVEDNEDSRELMRFALETYDMSVIDVEGSAEALNALEHSHFDLLISDIGMPVVDGYALIRAVRARRRATNIPAVAITAFARAADRAQALSAGFDVHIGKPCDFAILVPALLVLLATPRRCAQPPTT